MNTGLALTTAKLIFVSRFLQNTPAGFRAEGQHRFNPFRGVRYSERRLPFRFLVSHVDRLLEDHHDLNLGYRRGGRILDIGTGTGILSLILVSGNLVVRYGADNVLSLRHNNLIRSSAPINFYQDIVLCVKSLPLTGILLLSGRFSNQKAVMDLVINFR